MQNFLFCAVVNEVMINELEIHEYTNDHCSNEINAWKKITHSCIYRYVLYYSTQAKYAKANAERAF